MKNTFAVFALALSALSAGTAVQANEETYFPPSVSTLTRAQVQDDLNAWHAAGLSEESRGEQTPDVHGNDYRSKLANYQQLLAQQGSNPVLAAK